MIPHPPPDPELELIRQRHKDAPTLELPFSQENGLPEGRPVQRSCPINDPTRSIPASNG